MSYFVDAQRTTEKGAASGYASLGVNILVPTAQLGTETANDTKFLRGDQSWQAVAATPATTVTDETTFGVSKAPGSANTYAREDHTHGTPANPVPAHADLTTGIHGVGASTIESASGSQGKVDTHAALTTTHGVSGTIVGTSDTQTLSGKTLTTPVINGAKVAIATKTEAYPALATDYVLLGDCTTAAFSITLPLAADSTGQIYKIKKIDAETGHALTIDGNGTEKIDGAETKIITAQYDSVTIVCNGSNWYIV